MAEVMELVATRPIERPKARPITRIDRSAVFRLFWAVLAVALALFAQTTLEKRVFVGDGALMLLVAGLAFARASRGLALTTPAAPLAALPLPTLGLALLGVGAVLNAAGLALFGTAKEPGNLAWALYALSIPLALGGVYVLDARPSLRGL